MDKKVEPIQSEIVENIDTLTATAVKDKELFSEKQQEEREAAMRLERNAEHLMDKMRFDEALDFLRRAMTTFKKVQDHKSLGRVYSRQGYCFEQLQRFSEAESSYSESKEHFKNTDDKTGFADSADRLAKLHFWQEKTGDAIDEYKAAIEYGVKNSEIFNNLAFLQMSEEQFEEARQNLEKALEMRASESSQEVHITLNNLGVIEFLKENYKQAKEHFTEGIEKDLRLPEEDRSVQYIIFYNPCYKDKSFDRYRVAEDVNTMVCLKLNLAATLKTLDKNADVTDLIEDALNLERNRDYVHEAIGWIYLNEGNEIKALDNFRKAAPLAGTGEGVKEVISLINPYLDANVGRNEPCPCGSGKKYKKCHGKQV
ncbi:MAG: tetratricopeptide repeat protein [Vulcanimicrobiota bacterium]